MSLLAGFISKKNTNVLGPITCDTPALFGETVTRTVFTFSNLALGTEDPERYIIVAVHARHTSTSPRLTGVTLNNLPMTEIVQHRDTTGNLSISSLWGIKLPTGTTGTLKVTFSANTSRCMGAVHSIKNIGGLVPYATVTGLNGNNNPQIVSINTIADSLLIATAHNNNSSSSATWSGITETYDQNGVGEISGGYHLCTTDESPRSVQCKFTGTIDRTSAVSVVFYHNNPNN